MMSQLFHLRHANSALDGSEKGAALRSPTLKTSKLRIWKSAGVRQHTDVLKVSKDSDNHFRVKVCLPDQRNQNKAINIV